MRWERVKDKSVFACTKDYLKRFTILKNKAGNGTDLLEELHHQAENIVYNYVVCEPVDGGWTWQQYKELRDALRIIQSSTLSEKKEESVCIYCIFIDKSFEYLFVFNGIYGICYR